MHRYLVVAGVCAGIADAAGLALRALGLSNNAACALVLIAGGLTVIWRRRGSLRGDRAPLSVVGIGLVTAGVVLLLYGGGMSNVLAPGAVAGALLLVAGPWRWQLAVERDAERTARIRTDERAEVAARVHDSVASDSRPDPAARRRARGGSPRSRAGRSASCAAACTATASPRATRWRARSWRRLKTVEGHVSGVLRKLQLSSRAELTRWAAARRLI